MVIKNASYVKGAATYSQCIVSDLPQIAIAGKSNVGKSSLINFLVNDGKLARTSKLPGRTRLINYFLINEGRESEFLLADLPGYGFAKVSDAEKLKWADLLEKYLANERMLKHVFFLVDIRHDPTNDDVTMYNYLFHNNVPFTIVATKADKLPKSQVKNRCRAIANFLKVGADNVIATSSLNKTGKEAILDKIEQVLTAYSESLYTDDTELIREFRDKVLDNIKVDYVKQLLFNAKGDRCAIISQNADGSYEVGYEELQIIRGAESLWTDTRACWVPSIDFGVGRSIYDTLEKALDEVERSGFLK